MSNESRIEIWNGIEALLPRLWRFGFSLTRNDDAARELVQRACERILARADQYNAGTRLDRWAFTVMTNEWRMQLRRLRKTGPSTDEPADDLHDERTPSPEDAMFFKQVLAAIDALPDGQRRAVTLVYAEGYSYKEAALFLKVPTGTILSRLHAARRKLKILSCSCDMNMNGAPQTEFLNQDFPQHEMNKAE